MLDPACGTGAYVVEVLKLIHFRLKQQYGEATGGLKWVEALKRVYGFELLPAPYVVAHLQVRLAARRQQMQLTPGDRASIYLTNALTDGSGKKTLYPQFDQEREAAQAIKHQRPILVILGNPPYRGMAGIAEADEERALTLAYQQRVTPPKGKSKGVSEREGVLNEPDLNRKARV